MVTPPYGDTVSLPPFQDEKSKVKPKGEPSHSRGVTEPQEQGVAQGQPQGLPQGLWAGLCVRACAYHLHGSEFCPNTKRGGGVAIIPAIR